MTPRQIATGQAMRARGTSDAAIGQRFGVTRQHVHAKLGPRPALRKVPDPPRNGVTPEAFGAAVKAWRVNRNLSQNAAAKLLRVAGPSVSFWEQGRNGCSLAASMLLLMRSLDAVEGIESPREIMVDT
jgi:DNA-binding XRE family transcriptional regulator